MSSYIPRTSAPSQNDPNYINYLYGGNNHCIAIDTATGLVLPNCTGYCWGRWLELGVNPVNLSTGNATNWYGATWDGYSRGNVPRLGAIACFSGGSDSFGHVAVVEEIIDANAGTFKISNSAYNSYYFQYQTVTNFVFQSNYQFQGFIYNPLTFDADEYYIYATIVNRRRRRYED